MELHSTILGEGKPFLILHGFLGMSDNWKTMGKHLAEKGFEVHLIDQRNHGRSPHSNDFSYEYMSDDLVEYCKFHKLKDIVLMGHSMGGKTAMFMASNNPELVQKLIVVDIAPKYYAPHHQTILEGLKAIESATLSSRGDAEELLEQYVSDEGTKLFLLKNLYWKQKGELALRLNLQVLSEKIDNLGEALPQDKVFQKPTLFIKGEKSDYILPEDEEEIPKQFPQSIIVQIANAGHWVHAENMEDFFEEVIDFL